MTDVSKTNTDKIATREDALPLYAPPPAAYTGKIGVEVEMAFVKPGKGKPAIPGADEMQALQTTLKDKGYDAQLEPAGVLEYASPPASLDEIPALLQKVKTDLGAFEEAGSDAGFIRSPFSIVPTTTREEALSNMVSRERLQVSLKAMQELFSPETLRLPMLTTSVQTSFSPKDAEEMFRMAYRAYAMTPLLMAATNASSNFIVNEDAPLDYLPRGKYYLGYGDAGGISPAFLKSGNGEEFVRNHIDAVFNAPMHFAYDLGGGIIPAGKDNRITYARLVEQGLGTRSNYELAETFLYNDVKVCNLRDESGQVVGKRLEVRGADGGLDQPAMAVLLTAALVPEGKAAEEFDALLKDYGFTGNPKADAELFLSSRKAAVEHGGNFMDVAFGTGRLRDFAQDVAGILVKAYEGQKLESDMARLVEVLMTGECDAKIFAREMPTLQSAAAFLQGGAKAPANENVAAKQAMKTRRL
ncbi:MAG: hypothetical protein GC185_05010 [Alphaproteobacteria bacterium]|nr:hypothetical protein [Alphaproteobacteria bacterium]